MQYLQWYKTKVLTFFLDGDVHFPSYVLKELNFITLFKINVLLYYVSGEYIHILD